MGQNRFFTAVYIIGTGLAISMVMAIAVVYHIRTANIAPEVSRDRMGYVSNVSYEFNGGKGSLNSGCGPRFVKEVLYGLETPEKVAVTTNAAIMPYEVGDIFFHAPGSDEAPKVQLMGCDDAFWQVYRFSFLDGKPFASAEFLSGMPCVVLDRSLARRLLGRTEVAGQTVLINDIEYTISGVVEDISAVASDVYAEAWVPYTSMASIMDTALEEREGSAGLLLANCLLRDASDLPALSVGEGSKTLQQRLAGGTGESGAAPLVRRPVIVAVVRAGDVYRLGRRPLPLPASPGAEPLGPERLEDARPGV